MHTIKIALLATTTLFAFTACTDLGSGLPDWDVDTGDTGAWDDQTEYDPVIGEVSYSCDYGSPDRWQFYSRIDGWAGLATLDIYETGDGNWPSNPSAVWSESHTMSNSGYDADGAWDDWTASLSKVNTIGQQTAGSTTLFGCEWNDGGSLAFRETIFDDSGRELDCVIWGYQSQQYFNSHRGDDCVCIDPDGSCNN
jgi:hypothetical protein